MSTSAYLIRGEVMHKRHHPSQHRFQHPVFFLLMNIDAPSPLQTWLFGRNRKALISYHDKDHGDGRPARVWLQELLAKEGITDCDGDIWVQTFPRVLGFVFNPVSFWYCQRQDGSTGTIVAEVNNTFGERHCYVLRACPLTGEFTQIEKSKQFYVSPFYPVRGAYRFNFNTHMTRPRVSIDYYERGQLQLNTAIWGKARDFSRRNLLGELLRQPLLTFSIVTKIHWHALLLFLKGVPFLSRPTSSCKEFNS